MTATSTCRWLGGGTATQAACNAFPPCFWSTGSFTGNRCEADDLAIATGNNYMPGDVDVAIGDTTIAAINASLNPPPSSPGPQHPGAWTPTGRTLRNIASKLSQFGLDDTTRGNYIMLVTDGDANGDGGTFGVCDGALTGVRDLDNDGDIDGTDTTYARVNCALDALRAATPPVNTYVIGFGGGSSDVLNCHAVHGGTSRCATPPQCSAIASQSTCDTTRGCSWNAGSCTGGLDPTNCETPVHCGAISSQATCDSTFGCIWDPGDPSTSADDFCNVECFYRANDAAALSAAFTNIAGQIASCT
ncbi:MAG: hypothetical protein HYZ27_01515, partial [Deltaproteobacteria bacterium]|nr:hypothetical protein [Deltaproteobacteria bacterium]